MNIWTQLNHPQKEFQGGAITIGNFDGLHFGHQELLRQATPGPRVVMTFDPHPLQVLRPQQQLTHLFPRQDLLDQLPKFGVDLLAILPFSASLAQLSAEEFWRTFVHIPFAPQTVVAGHDFAFGKDRAGDLNFLRKWCADRSVQLKVVEPLKIDGQIVSSRAIREFVRQGDVEAAAHRLGRYFYLRGVVGHGAGRGKSIGVPTLNFKVMNEIIPANGVYATRTRWQGGLYPSVTNIGVNPTFGGQEGLKIETHVIGREVEVRDQVIDVEFVTRLRDEMKFSSIEDLKKQIKDDILKANEALDRIKPHQ